MYSEIIKNSAKLLSVDIFLKIGGFFVTIAYLSIMTKSDYGILGYVLTIVSILSGILSLGQYVVQSKLYHDESLAKNELEINIHFVIFSSYVIFLIAGLSTKEYWTHLLFSTNVSIIVVLAVLFLPLSSILLQILSTYLYTSKKIREVRLLSISQFTISSVLGVLIVWLFNKKISSLELILIWNFTSQILILLNFYSTYFNFKDFNFKIIKTGLLRRNLKLGIPIAISSLTGILFDLGDKYMIQKYIDANSLGIFTFASVWASIPLTLFSPFQNIWLPHFYKEKNLVVNLNRSRKIAFMWLCITILLLPLLSSIVYLISGKLIDLSYRSSINSLCYLVLAGGFQIVSHLHINFYNLIEMNRVLILISIFTGISNIAMNYFLIPIFGLDGVALATLFISGMSMIINIVVVNRSIYKILSTQNETK